MHARVVLFLSSASTALVSVREVARNKAKSAATYILRAVLVTRTRVRRHHSSCHYHYDNKMNDDVRLMMSDSGSSYYTRTINFACIV